MNKTAADGTVLHTVAMELCDNPVDAINALTAALGSMIVLNTKDDSRESAHRVCDIMAQMLHEGTDKFFNEKQGRVH